MPRLRPSARQLARLVGIDPSRYAAKVPPPGPKAFVEAITLRSDDPVLEKQGPAIEAVNGSLTVPASRCSGRPAPAPLRSSAPSDEATAEQVAESNGRSRPATRSARTGSSSATTSSCAARPGSRSRPSSAAPTAASSTSASSSPRCPPRGEPLEAQPRPRAQTAAEHALAKQTSRPTALVAVRVSTGEVLAAAVGPGAKGSTLALAGKAAPGSTFKIVSSLALVRKGATADSRCRAPRRSPSTGGASATTPATPRTSSATSRCRPPSPSRATRPSSASTRRSARTTSPPRRSRSAWARSSTCRSPASSGRCRRPTTSSSTPRRSSARAGSRPRR